MLMKKFFLILSLFSLCLADDLNKALEYEKKGDYKRAMQIYKNIALKNQTPTLNIAQTPNSNEIAVKQKESKSTKIPTTKEQKREKDNFSKIALANYLGDENSFNPLGISSYKMNYFLPFSHTNHDLSGSKNEVKFQISIKKRLFENLLGLDEKYYLGYTQTSLWQLYRHSSPFRENSYQPEFFVDFPIHFDGYDYFNNLRLGFLHESNGKDDDHEQSRSWNRLYASTTFLYKRFLIVPRIWYRINEDGGSDDNPAMEHYMGNFDVNLGYLGNDFFINTMLRNNLNFSRNKGAVQVDIGYDVFNNGMYYYVQYFNGYGDSLIDYNKRLERISMGFLISY